jgi:hypothetical protein
MSVKRKQSNNENVIRFRMQVLLFDIPADVIMSVPVNLFSKSLHRIRSVCGGQILFHQVHLFVQMNM